MPTTAAKFIIPPTGNEAWGFWGTMRRHVDPAEAWPLALTAIVNATGCSPDEVRAFLDSRHGRHFADEVTNGLVADRPLETSIDTAVTAWMGWTIGRRLSREEGIPQGLPYLTGFVLAEAIAAEAA